MKEIIRITEITADPFGFPIARWMGDLGSSGETRIGERDQDPATCEARAEDAINAEHPPRHPFPPMTYDIHFFKTTNLSPDEKNAMRRNASGLWLVGGRIEAKSARAACAAYRKSRELGCDAAKLRALTA